MKKWAVLIGLLSAPALAAESPIGPTRGAGPQECFEVAQTHDFVGSGEILVNRCTGATWLLVKSGIGMEGGFVFRWAPISMTPGEAVLTDPASRAEAAERKKMFPQP